MKKRKIKQIRANIKKDFKNFMKDESGLMSKENILKVGMGTLAALSMFSGVARAECNDGDNPRNWPNGVGVIGYTVHQNSQVMVWDEVGPGERKRFFPSHAHHCIHESY